MVTRSRLNSRSSRSWMISMWSMPKKPQRKPKPRATEVSGSKVREASLSCSFSRASRRSGYLAAVLGVDAAVDHGLGRPVAGQGLGGGTLRAGDGVAHPGVLHVLDGGGEVAHLPGAAGRRQGSIAQGPQVAALQHADTGRRWPSCVMVMPRRRVPSMTRK